MAAISLNRVLENENSVSHKQNLVKTMPSSNHQKIGNRKNRTAFGELSNTINTNIKSSEQIHKSALKQKNRKIDQSSKTVSKPKIKHIFEKKNDEVESLPTIPNYNEEEEYDEFIWSKAERLTLSDLRCLKSWTQRKKAQKVVNISNSSDEDIKLSLDFVISAPTKLLESPIDQDLLFDDTILDPVLFSDDDDVILNDRLKSDVNLLSTSTQIQDSRNVSSVSELMDYMTLDDIHLDSSGNEEIK